MQGCLTKFRILFHCLLDGEQFILSIGGSSSNLQGWRAVQVLSGSSPALTWRPRCSLLTMIE